MSNQVKRRHKRKNIAEYSKEELDLFYKAIKILARQGNERLKNLANKKDLN